MLITLGVAKKGNGCKLDSAICNTFKGKKWSCPEAFNLKTGVPLRNLRRTCSMSLVFTTPALKRKAVEHPEGVVFWRLWMKHSATEYLQCVWLFFLHNMFFFRIPNKLHLHVKYISYVFYIYIHTPICIYIYICNSPTHQNLPPKKRQVIQVLCCFIRSKVAEELEQVKLDQQAKFCDSMCFLKMFFSFLQHVTVMLGVCFCFLEKHTFCFCIYIYIPIYIHIEYFYILYIKMCFYQIS